MKKITEYIKNHPLVSVCAALIVVATFTITFIEFLERKDKDKFLAISVIDRNTRVVLTGQYFLNQGITVNKTALFNGNFKYLLSPNTNDTAISLSIHCANYQKCDTMIVVQSDLAIVVQLSQLPVKPRSLTVCLRSNMSQHFKHELSKNHRKLNFNCKNPDITIELSYSGNIKPLRHNQNLFHYEGGNIMILRNGDPYYTFKEFKLSQSMPFGNSKEAVELECEEKLEKIITANHDKLWQKISDMLYQE